jgi:glycosyltransferase involved in cell wall biosynthesis
MKNINTSISIVTLSFNQGEYLGQCTESILEQLGDNDEYIIVDPGSNDNSSEVISAIRSKIILVNEKDSGPPQGLNNGFKMASNRYYYFLNADDILMPGAIKNMKLAISHNPNIDVFCFSGFFTDSVLNIISPMRCFNFSAKRFCLGLTSVFQQGCLFKSDIFNEVGGFNEKNYTCWDAELLLDMSLQGATFLDINKDVAMFRLHDNSITGSNNNYLENNKVKDRLFYKVFLREATYLSRTLPKIFKYIKYISHPSFTMKKVFFRLKRRMTC